jgi:hypothetical protein
MATLMHYRRGFAILPHVWPSPTGDSWEAITRITGDISEAMRSRKTAEREAKYELEEEERRRAESLENPHELVSDEAYDMFLQAISGDQGTGPTLSTEQLYNATLGNRSLTPPIP